MVIATRGKQSSETTERNQGTGKKKQGGKQEERKREQDIPLVRLCDCGTWPARTFFILNHLSDQPSRELSFSKQQIMNMRKKKQVKNKKEEVRGEIKRV